MATATTKPRLSWIERWLTKSARPQPKEIIPRTRIVGVTLGWDGYPTISFLTNDGVRMLPRKAEDIIREQYYPDGPRSWPKNPKTGEKLPIDDT